MSAVLGQVREPNGRPLPVCYYSRKLGPAELNYDAVDRECLAMVAACKQWRPYLDGGEHPFVLRTDTHALSEMYARVASGRDPYGRMARWIEILGRYQFTVQHRPNRGDVDADVLSRKPDFEGWGDSPADRRKLGGCPSARGSQPPCTVPRRSARVKPTLSRTGSLFCDGSPNSH